MTKAQRRAATAVVLFLITVALLALIRNASPDLLDAQRATKLSTFDKAERNAIKDAAIIDFFFMAAYGALFVFLFSLIQRPRQPDKLHPAAWAGSVFAIGGLLADVAENAFLLMAIDAESDGWLDEMRIASIVKWGLLGTATLTLVTLALLRAWRPPLPLGPSTAKPDGADWSPAKANVGVCLSGGGIRSAAFSLGALQVLREKGKLDKAKYLAAASGGGYLAAGWALSNNQDIPAGDPKQPWAPGSPEERWFRDHSSYLIPDTAGGFAGLFRLLAGLVVNLVLIGVLLSAVSRPIGWAMHEAHKELRAGPPVVLASDDIAKVVISPLTRAGTVEMGPDERPVRRFAITVAPDPDDSTPACFYKPDEKKRVDRCVKVVTGAAGIVEVQAGKVKVVRQPKVKIDEGSGPLAGVAQVTEGPRVAVADELVADEADPAPANFKVERHARIATKTGLKAMTWPTYDDWIWQLVGGLLGASLLVALGAMVFRPVVKRSERVRSMARALGGTGLAAFVVLIALPWLVVWLPRTLADLADKTANSATGSAAFDYLVPGGGLLALVLTAANQYRAGGSGKDGSGTGDSKGSIFKKIKDTLKGKEKELKWYELNPLKIAVFVLSMAAVVVVFVNSLQFSAANGWKGTLMGFGLVRESLPPEAFLEDRIELLILVGALGAFALVADAHAWSLFPFYKERLSSAYLLHRPAGDPTRAEPVPYHEIVPFSSLDPAAKPQLIACCAVNLSEYGVVPPGRRAASFTFSSTEIGGPLVGYATPAQYDMLPENRKRDLTVASAMAISGAAFSPAMGKTNLGPVGALLALANLRLGVWLPNPHRAKDPAKAEKEWDWRRFRRPHWVWYLRELTNKYKHNRRYLYVTDGGHWDNLGLVELLRRGCTEIYCISGAGDRSESFGTIGEAVALAREELGVEIQLDCSDLRPSTTPASPAWKRQLLRPGAKDKAANFAKAPAVKGTFKYTWSNPEVDGVIYYVEADLTENMPFDVHTFAENESDFPDDSTADQVFNHRQFESYRALGRHQAAAAVKLTEKPPPEPSCAQKLKRRVKKAICP